MTSPSSFSLFRSFVDVWKLLALRSDVDELIGEVLGRFSLEKVYCDRDGETYQRMMTELLAQLTAIYYIQRLSLPTENLQSAWYLNFLASWEVTIRCVEVVLQAVIDSMNTFAVFSSILEAFLAKFLMLTLRVLSLHPIVSPTPQSKDRRCRFARIDDMLQRLLNICSDASVFLFKACKHTTKSLRNDQDALVLPSELRYELPNMTLEMYNPVPNCILSDAISRIVRPGILSEQWISQFLALRDVAYFWLGMTVQYAVNAKHYDVQFESMSVITRSAILAAIDNMKVPLDICKKDMASSICEIFQSIISESHLFCDSHQRQLIEAETDALTSLCARLRDRQVIQRVSDRATMHSLSQLWNNAIFVEDPTGTSRPARPSLFAVNCEDVHLVGGSQLRHFADPTASSPVDIFEMSEVKLVSEARCPHCRKAISKAREITIVRRFWDLMKPLEPNADLINVERHLSTKFVLQPPRVESLRVDKADPNDSLENDLRRDTEQRPPNTSQVAYKTSSRTFETAQIRAPANPRHCPEQSQLEDSRGFMTSPTSTAQESQRSPNGNRALSWSSAEAPFSPNSITANSPYSFASEPSPSSVISGNWSVKNDTTSSLQAVNEKGKSRWKRLTVSRREISSSSETNNKSSGLLLEPEKPEQICLKGLTASSGEASQVTSVKSSNVHVNLSTNSTSGIFWTQASIQLWELCSIPPTLIHTIRTGNICILAAVTKNYLAYVVKTPNQQLTLQIVDLVRPDKDVQYNLPSTPWCTCVALSPNETHVVVGFESSTVRVFKTTAPEQHAEEYHSTRFHKCDKDCPEVVTVSFSHDSTTVLISTRSPKTGLIQIFILPQPFREFQEVLAGRQNIPIYECEDGGVSAALIRPGSSKSNRMLCITTWTQFGVPILVQVESQNRIEIKSEAQRGQGKLGSRIQCAAFSPSGAEIALVNENGDVYLISNLDVSRLTIQRLTSTKRFTTRTAAFAMGISTIPDGDKIITAWASSSKAIGYIKKIPLRLTIDTKVTGQGERVLAVPYVAAVELAAGSVQSTQVPAELPGDDLITPSR